MESLKENYKAGLAKKETDKLIMELKNLKNDLLYMNECLEDKNVSYEQKSEFLNCDIPNTKENIEIIEEVLNERKR